MSKRILSFVLSMLLLVAVGGAWVQRDQLFDAWRLHGYSAPAQVSQLADTTSMTPKARHLFYVYRPSLEDKAAFNSHCTNSEQTIVLGCYVQRQGIYLYNVSDARLKGVVEVTAAHEMLHAAYDRLSAKERAHVDTLTAQTASTITDERLKATIENYRKKDPSVVPNELHSILGTELRGLSPELETYYKQYFSDRAVVVDFAETYQKAFTEREQEVASIDAKLASTKTQIDTLNASLETQQTDLKTQYDDLQQQKRAGNTEAYNAAVPAYNQSVSSYNAAVNQQRSLVKEYNALVEQRNNLALEENELIKALDSRPTIDTQ